MLDGDIKVERFWHGFWLWSHSCLVFCSTTCWKEWRCQKGGGFHFIVGSVSMSTVNLLILPPFKLFNIGSFVYVAVINCFQIYTSGRKSKKKNKKPAFSQKLLISTANNIKGYSIV